MASPTAARVAVFMSTFQCRDWLPRAIASVIAQTYAPLDLYVVDDCSGDVDRDLLDRFPEVTFVRLRTQGGPYVADNLLLRLVPCDLVGFHDADDASEPDRFALQADFLDRTGADGCGCWCIHEDLNGDPVGFDVCPSADDLFEPAVRSRLPFHPASLYRRRVFDTLGGFDASTRFGADTEFIWRAHHRFALANVPRFLYRHLVRPSSLTLDRSTGIHRPAREAYRERLVRAAESLGDGEPLAGTLMTGAPVEFPSVDVIEWVRPRRGADALAAVPGLEIRS
jgi:glycosyltransferase involved in cell wall biosynthesis